MTGWWARSLPWLPVLHRRSDTEVPIGLPGSDRALWVRPTSPKMPREDAVLKNKTLQALTRLGDRDTQRVAVKELERLAANAHEPDHVTTIVLCLCEELVAAPKASARREILRLFDRVCALRGESALVHLPRMVSSVCRRFKDPDSNVSDACVDTMGALAEFTCSLPPRIDKTVATGPDSIGVNFLRPILDVLHETNSKQAQDTACRAMARVIRRCGPGAGNANVPAGNNWYPDGGVGKLAVRLARALELPNFHAKPALLHAVTALFAAAGGQCGSHLPVVLGVPPPEGSRDGSANVAEWNAVTSHGSVGTNGGVLGALASEEWPTRRAAAQAITALVYALGPMLDNANVTLTPLLDAIERALDVHRHDKVKPARDAVAAAAALVAELKNFRDKGPGGDDLGAWRNWAREELGEGIADVGEHVGSNGAAGLKPGVASPRRPRGAGAGTARRELSEAFMEAHAPKELPTEGDVVEVAVPKNPPPAHVVDATEVPAQAAADVTEGASEKSTRGGWDGAADGTSTDGDENVPPHRPQPVSPSQQRPPVVPPSKQPPVASRSLTETEPFTFDTSHRMAPDGSPDDDDPSDGAAPGWMSLAKEIESGAKTRLKTRVDPNVVVAANDESSSPVDIAMAAGDSTIDAGEVAALRKQMTALAAAQATVLERIGVFVQESSRAIQTLTARIDASESAVADAVERVEVMENQVGAAVSASAAVASSAAALAAQHPDTAKLAQERAALEREKAQLRDAAAQLERAASNLERVVPPPRR